MALGATDGIQEQNNHEQILSNGNGNGNALKDSDTIKKKSQKDHNQFNDVNANFLRAARAGDLEKIIELLSTRQVTDINTCNPNGLNALHLASKDGHLQVVTFLLENGAKVNNATKKGNTPLHIAALAGQKDILKELINHGANVNVQSQNGFSALYMAAQENHVHCVRLLLASGALQDLATEDGFTPLMVAMQQGHERVVSCLLENEGKDGKDGKVRLPALHIAAKKDDINTAKLLLNNSQSPDVASKSGFTPLHIAAHYGNINIGKFLVEQGADVNYQAKHYITPLHVACKWGTYDMCEMLIENGAKINALTRDGLTPLHCAARNGHARVIQLLLDNNAPIQSKTKNGLTALHMAAQGNNIEAARLLLQHKSPVDEVTSDYLTPLHVATHCGHLEMAKLLLNRNADVNARALNGFTPLHIACKKNRIKLVELLLQHGANISATTENGLTPLHVASFMGCMNIVIYLLQHKADIDVATVRGETALHYAVRSGQTDIIRILLRNGAKVNSLARDNITPLHVASRLDNIDNVMLLIQHGANIEAQTSDAYTPLHVSAREGQYEITQALLDNHANQMAQTRKGFTPLHLAAKFGHLKIAEHLIEKSDSNKADIINMPAKNGVTPLHVASHYNHPHIVELLLDNDANIQAAAKNGHTALHIAAKRNYPEIVEILLNHGADSNSTSTSGFTPLHLAVQQSNLEIVKLLLKHNANVNQASQNGLQPIHLAVQNDVNLPICDLLLENKADINAPTQSGYTPLHISTHYGQINITKYLLEHDANVESNNQYGYTPLHQAAQQGHTLIINLLLKHKANPSAVTKNGHTALNIAQKLGYVTVIENLKTITVETTTTTETLTKMDDGGTQQAITTEKYKVLVPEQMQENYLIDAEDDDDNNDDTGIVVGSQNGEHDIDHPMMYMHYGMQQHQLNNTLPRNSVGGDPNTTIDHLFGGGYDQFDTSMNTTKDSIIVQLEEQHLQQQHNQMYSSYMPKPLDNVDIVKNPIHVGFLVSFMVDARGGAMRGCRHSGVHVIVPPNACVQPTRITCRYVKPHRIVNPPPLMEGEALVSRILELGPSGYSFSGPVILEVPHFASLRDKEREIIILRSENGDTWREHILNENEEAIQEVLNEIFKPKGDNEQQQFLDDLHTNRIIRIVTHDFPQFFAVVSRVRQEVHAIGPDGGTISSIVVPQVQTIFPPHALTKKIRVGIQAQPVDVTSTAKLLGNSVAVSPVVTVEPRRRKFHKAITINIPAPKTQTQGMTNQYTNSSPTLRLLCSITGGQNLAVWEDVTGSTQLNFINDCISFTTTVSARFWLMDCRNIGEACNMAAKLYKHITIVPYMVKYLVMAKIGQPPVYPGDNGEIKFTIFIIMDDDRDNKTYESFENYIEIARSRDIELLQNFTYYIEFSNTNAYLQPIQHKNNEQLYIKFEPFKENRLQFNCILKRDFYEEYGNEPTTSLSLGRINFMVEPKQIDKTEPHQQPVCALNLQLPSGFFTNSVSSKPQTPLPENLSKMMKTMRTGIDTDSEKSDRYIKEEKLHKADIRLSDICRLLRKDWIPLGKALNLDDHEINEIEKKDENDEEKSYQMLRLWLSEDAKRREKIDLTKDSNELNLTGNILEEALKQIGRSDIVDRCIYNIELVTDEDEKRKAKAELEKQIITTEDSNKIQDSDDLRNDEKLANLVDSVFADVIENDIASQIIPEQKASRIPKTIKKHSKIDRDLLEQHKDEIEGEDVIEVITANIAQQRPTIKTIEWNLEDGQPIDINDGVEKDVEKSKEEKKKRIAELEKEDDEEMYRGRTPVQEELIVPVVAIRKPSLCTEPTRNDSDDITDTIEKEIIITTEEHSTDPETGNQITVISTEKIMQGVPTTSSNTSESSDVAIHEAGSELSDDDVQDMERYYNISIEQLTTSVEQHRN